MLIGALIISLVACGVHQVHTAAGNAAEAPAINVSNNVIINVGAGESGIPPDRLADLVSAAARGRKADAKDAIALK
ncbi:hypothetical protein A9J41_15135 [Laribacter hongkongensis]|nr:hypothetical protein [Laribacter hongkongensis]